MQRNMRRQYGAIRFVDGMTTEKKD
jgi:hypothetical protein